MKSLLIPDLLKSAQDNLNCDRALVAKLHGSSKLDLTNSSFSVLFECLKDDFFSIKPIVKNRPIKVLDYEFLNQDIDFISVVNKAMGIGKEEVSCYNHLDKIGCSVIINQLLHIDSYVWGILSFQYKACPFYINGIIIEEKYLSIIKNYKQLISSNF